MSELLEIRLLGPFEVLTGGTPRTWAARSVKRCWRCSRSEDGRMVAVDALVDGLWGEELPAAPRNALHHHIARLRAALGEASIVGSADGYALRMRTSTPCGSRSCWPRRARALRAGDAAGRGGRGRAALALWRGPALQGLTGTAWFERRGTPARDAAGRRARGAVRGGARARRAPRAGRRRPLGARGQPVPGAAVGPADAGPLPQRPPGRRARGVPGGPARARRRAGARAGAGAPAAPGGDPCARPRDRRRPRRPGAAAAISLRLRPRSSAARTRSARSAALLRRAPPGDADRPARRRQEPARARAGALARGRVPGRHLARRLRARGRRGRRRPTSCARRRRSRLRSARARDFPASPRSGSARSRRVRARARRGSPDRVDASSPSVPRSGSWRRAARRSTSRAR